MSEVRVMPQFAEARSAASWSGLLVRVTETLVVSSVDGVSS